MQSKHRRNATSSGLLILLLSTLLLSSGCSSLIRSNQTSTTSGDAVHSQSRQSASKQTDATTSQDEQDSSIAKTKPFPAPTLYSLLVAEMAGKRKRYDIALFNYLDQARITGDPQVAERALRIAQFVGSGPHALEALAVWLEADPNNPEVIQAAAQVAIEQKRWNDAIEHLKQLKKLDTPAPFDYLAAKSNDAAEDDQKFLMDELKALQSQYPKDYILTYALGILHQNNDELNSALQLIDRSLKINKQYLNATIQKGRILVLQDKADAAIKWLEKSKKRFPNNIPLLRLLGRLQLEQKDYSTALITYEVLYDLDETDGATIISLALIHQELNDISTAREYLLALREQSAYRDEANYYLGRLAEDDSDYDQAVGFYQAVGQGREFLPAILSASRLIADHQSLAMAREYLSDLRSEYPKLNIEFIRIESDILIDRMALDDAMDLLTTALVETPENIDLLYTRAMLAERLDNLELLESDLLTVLSINPNNPEALNALGYTLADRTPRIEDARVYLEQAIALAPDNPAIVDSMGWLYFKEGNLLEAEDYLKRAYELMPDHEIAAHYGELLWITNRRKEARIVWEKGLSQTPDSQIIEQTFKRLGVE